jgi:hypothetical protein
LGYFLTAPLEEEPKKIEKGLTIPEEKCIGNKGKNLNRPSNPGHCAEAPRGVPCTSTENESAIF